MRKRIFWLLPDLASARRTMDDLLLARVENSHIHFVARDGADMTGLHEANLFQTSDIVHAAEMGLMVGGGVGVVAGVVVAMFPIVSDTPQWGLVGVLAVLGAVFGAWAASMIGSSAPNSRLRAFEKDIEAGKILLMVDVPRTRVEEVETLLRNAHPEASFAGVDPAVPAFP
ncbi:DUF1269 domain-containing protein [Cupriavidus taiwanensis]|uniref:Transmembrane protein n=1 Tax=Cupriavidus taiwanensis TaxID=164546 RepID=A0A375INM0_9BURK|nr:DUF1269 domain-containing protein [Cupriavidus taiwanensis]SOY69158.1 conserved hypothetical protein; putative TRANSMEMBRANE PROTEIN [Cupriavidus taiwanensis]SOY69826.1 conserved hypothetical protein; putative TRANSMEMBRANE PROTEIN [Cupriavidus taiwanensis]SOY92239.1 conserved hypothetical protein; putative TRANSMEMBRANE PROTEIN [Cupriavidus taiwanensis]SOZ29409.1 conserved hypothetical protein; putative TRANSMEMBRANE PROTEIN [Cupriavidus taiwanensis]SOZ74008.1 conserved hypothetical protei